MAEPRRLRLADVARMVPGEARVFSYARGGEQREGFLLYHPQGLFAYRNRCPHWGVDLDLGDGRFYAPENDRVYCKNHGALFRVSDGYCEQGPCRGLALERFVVERDGDDALVTVESE
jgi:nitrite reductase/ring-hydroxylating ferredoxin subunit